MMHQTIATENCRVANKNDLKAILELLPENERKRLGPSIQNMLEIGFIRDGTGYARIVSVENGKVTGFLFSETISNRERFSYRILLCVGELEECIIYMKKLLHLTDTGTSISFVVPERSSRLIPLSKLGFRATNLSNDGNFTMVYHRHADWNPNREDARTVYRRVLYDPYTQVFTGYPW